MPRLVPHALVLLIGLSTFSTPQRARAEIKYLPAPVQRTLAHAHLSGRGLSIWIQDVSSNRPFLAVRENVPRNPASVMKLITTAAALHELGPDFRWKTYAYLDGPLHRGRLDGNLVLVGQGDPFLVTENFWKFLRRLRDEGLRRIHGDLVVDESYFDPVPHSPGDFDNRPYRVYNAQPEALLLNFNAIEFRFRPDRETRTIAISTDPPNSVLHIVNELRYVDGPCRARKFLIFMHVNDGPLRDTVRFSGNYPWRCGHYQLLRSVSASNASYIFGVFKSLWEELGGRIDGTLKLGRKPRNARLLYAAESPPLAEQIRSINKFSNNVMARDLLLTLGAERRGPPGTEAKGRSVVEQWLASIGVDRRGLVLDNGAGLSRDGRVTARMLGHMLVKIYRGPWMPEFMASLPIAAVDGTMKTRFRSTALEGRMHLKTGLIDNVRSIAGYVLARSGRTYAVVMLHNAKNVQNGLGTEVQNTLLEWLFRH